MLEDFGHKIDTVNNGFEATQNAFNKNYDLLLMDIQMPGMDGMEATRIIREEQKARKIFIPIIAVTAHAIKGDKEKFLAGGMDAYIAKPVSMQDLFDVIELTMEKQESDIIEKLEKEQNDKIESVEDIDRVYLDEMINKIRSSYVEGNNVLIEKHTNSLKAYVERFGLTKMKQLAFKLQMNARKGKLEGGDELLDQFEKIYQDITKIVK
jgi:hypothetical protein